MEAGRGLLRRSRLVLPTASLCLTMTVGAQTFDDDFDDRTLRLDYVLATS